MASRRQGGGSRDTGVAGPRTRRHPSAAAGRASGPDPASLPALCLPCAAPSATAAGETEERCRFLFDRAPVCLLEQDCSAVLEYARQLRARGVRNIASYLGRNAGALLECVKRVRTVAVNRATLELFGCRDLEDYLASLPRLLGPESYEASRRAVIAAATGEPSFRAETVVRTRSGQRRSVIWRWVVAPGYEETLGRVLGSLTDITELKRAERERERLLRKATASRQELRRLARRLVEVQEAERRALARELHDQVGQTLAVLSLSLKVTREQLGGLCGEGVAARLDEPLAMVAAVVEHTRVTMLALRPPVLDELGLPAALEWVAEQTARHTGVRASVVVRGPALGRLDADMETALYRIAQEALTNVAKHAQATEVEVCLEQTPAGLRMTVRDDGVGLSPSVARRRRSPSAGGGLGMVGMGERATAIGARLRVSSRRGQGTTVTVDLPLDTATG